MAAFLRLAIPLLVAGCCIFLGTASDVSRSAASKGGGQGLVDVAAGEVVNRGRGQDLGEGGGDSGGHDAQSLAVEPPEPGGVAAEHPEGLLYRDAGPAEGG